MAITPYLRLQKPPFDIVPWDDSLNGNMDIIDAFAAQVLGIPNYVGAWQNSTSYIAGQNVSDITNAGVYQVQVTHTSSAIPATFGQDRLTFPTYWELVSSPNVVNIIPGNTGRNLLHNPLFNIQQRGAGPFNLNAQMTADRWQMSFAGGSLTCNIVTAVDAHRSQIGDEAVRLFLGSGYTGGAASGNYALLSQAIEDVRRLAGKTVTVSFWAAAAPALTLGLDLVQNFGTGGSPSVVVGGIGARTFTLTTSFVRHSATITVPSIAGKTLGTSGNDSTVLRFWLTAGAGTAGTPPGMPTQTGNISIWGVQLEIGSVATPLEKPDPRYDLSNCQRFFHYGFFASIGYATTGDFVGAAYTFPVTMRGLPTVTIGAPVAPDVGVSTAATDMTNQLGFRYAFTSTITGVIQGSRYFTASADL